jgi:hypothetical protein
VALSSRRLEEAIRYLSPDIGPSPRVWAGSLAFRATNSAGQAFALEFVDLGGGGSPAVKEWLENASRPMLDPLTDTPFRFALLKESDGAFHWYAHYHHLIVDGLAVRYDVIAQLYTALMHGTRRC